MINEISNEAVMVSGWRLWSLWSLIVKDGVRIEVGLGVKQRPAACM